MKEAKKEFPQFWQKCLILAEKLNKIKKNAIALVF